MGRNLIMVLLLATVHAASGWTNGQLLIWMDADRASANGRAHAPGETDDANASHRADSVTGAAAGAGHVAARVRGGRIRGRGIGRRRVR